MKLIILLFAIILNCVDFACAQDQEIDKKIVHRAIYNFSFKTNSNQTEFVKTDLMYLDISSQRTLFYSYYEQARDSVKKDGLKKGLPAYEIVENMRNYKRGISCTVYTFLDRNKRIVTDTFIKHYFYDEALQLPLWQIYENENKEISGYVCQKAETNYLGRTWTVYFTPEIPYNYGPWKLWGLPGLILAAQDKENLFCFELSGFEKIEITSSLMLDFEKENDFTQVTKERFNNMEQLFYKDRIEFQKIIMPGTIVHMNEQQTDRYRKLKEMGGVPYIPLEPW